MSLADAFAPSDAAYKNKVLIATFGHLHPEWEKVYPIAVTFTHAYYSESVIIDMETTVEDSPWFADHVHDLISPHPHKPRDWKKESRGWYVRNMRIEQGKIYTFVGTYRVRSNGSPVFKGKVVRRKLKEMK